MAARIVPIPPEPYIYGQVALLASDATYAISRRYPQAQPWLLLGCAALLLIGIAGASAQQR